MQLSLVKMHALKENLQLQCYNSVHSRLNLRWHSWVRMALCSSNKLWRKKNKVVVQLCQQFFHHCPPDSAGFRLWFHESMCEMPCWTSAGLSICPLHCWLPVNHHWWLTPLLLFSSGLWSALSETQTFLQSSEDDFFQNLSSELHRSAIAMKVSLWQ